jgi:hypothetical protein
MSATAIPEGRRGDNNRDADPCVCLACGTKIIGPWCHNCGQKNDDCRRSVFRLAAETVADAAALDGRFLRTCRSAILRPGSHVRQYAHGKRSPFTPPIRFFLVVTFLFFTTLWLTDRHLFVFQPIVDAEQQEGGFEIRLGGDAAEEGSEADAEAQEATDEEAEPGVWFYGGFLKPAKDVSYTEEQRQWLMTRISEGDEPGSSEEEGAVTDAEDGGLTINGRTVSSSRLLAGLVQTAENPAAFNNALNEWIPRMMLLFIPFMAILGTLFIRGPDALVYDHLLIAIQVHGFAFLILTLSLWTSWLLPAEVAGWAFFLGVPLYYLLSIKGAFGRSWRKTAVATVFTTSVYSFTFVIALMLAAVASFFEVV